MQLFDILVICVAFLLSSAFSHPGSMTFAEFLSLKVKVFNLAVFTLFLFLCHTFFRLQGVYHSQRLSKRSGEIVGIIKAVSLDRKSVV